MMLGRKEMNQTLSHLEAEIDKAAAQLWGITDDELKTIQEALKDMEKPGGNRKRKSTTEVCWEQIMAF